MTKLEELEQNLSDLAAKEAQLLKKLHTLRPEESFEIVESEREEGKHLLGTPSKLSSPYECRQLLLVLKHADLQLLKKSIEWLQEHGPACYSSSCHLSVALPSSEGPIQVSRATASEEDQSQAPIFSAVPNESLCVFGFTPVQMVRGCVALCQQAAPETGRVPDVVVVAGCCALNRREFEQPDYTPLLEEILLKEAVQPVILIK